jgi:hypothetical protein
MGALDSRSGNSDYCQFVFMLFGRFFRKSDGIQTLNREGGLFLKLAPQFHQESTDPVPGKREVAVRYSPLAISSLTYTSEPVLNILEHTTVRVQVPEDCKMGSSLRHVQIYKWQRLATVLIGSL